MRSGTFFEGLISLPIRKNSCPISLKNAFGQLQIYSCKSYRSVIDTSANVGEPNTEKLRLSRLIFNMTQRSFEALQRSECLRFFGQNYNQERSDRPQE
jgi:hypothetical protein